VLRKVTLYLLRKNFFYSSR